MEAACGKESRGKVGGGAEAEEREEKVYTKGKRDGRKNITERDKWRRGTTKMK